MHELYFAQQLLAAVDEAAGPAQVVRMVVRVGAASGICREALRLALEASCELQGTTEPPRIDVVPVPGRGRCARCQRSFALDEPFGLCSVCVGEPLVIEEGGELELYTVEVRDVHERT
jgi:hydrogenase nickel incorporation protein HypA/HybF